MAKRIQVGGRIESKEVGGIVTGAAEILDDAKGKKQSVINQETDDELLHLDQSKQDNLTFDNAPTEGSDNPVKSGGVYAADKALSDAIEAILLLIPSAASALNKLVDTAMMNSSISTATATFRGTYNVVTDLSLTVDATHEQIAAALGNAISTADNNDYAFVQVPISAESTDIRRTERYKFNGTAWGYEYDLNTSGFTAAQWAAINSGITLALVGKLIGLPTSSELQALLGQKQDTLTFDNVPTAGSANPVKSGGVHTAINDEKTAREQLANTVTGIDGRVENIEEVIPAGAADNNKLVANNSMEAYVTSIIEAITASFSIATADGHINLTLTQTNGRVASLTLTSSDIASAQALTALTGRVSTAESDITSLGGRVSTNETDIANLQQLYNDLQQSKPVPVTALPETGQQQGVIYRLAGTTSYSDYMWNGSTWVLMATYNNAIDDEPTAGSDNLVKSGGVWKAVNGYSIAEYNKYVNTNGTTPPAQGYFISNPISVKQGQRIYITFDRDSGNWALISSYDNGTLTMLVSAADYTLPYVVLSDGQIVVSAKIGLKIKIEEKITDKEVFGLIGDYVRKYGTVITSDNYSSLLPDFDDAPANTVIVIASGLQSILHKPPFQDGGGTLLSFNPYSDQTGEIQIIIPSSGYRMAFRMRWASWKDWQIIPWQSDIDNLISNIISVRHTADASIFASIFSKALFIGDSLMQGAYYGNPYYSWVGRNFPNLFCRIGNMGGVNEGHSGINAKDWYEKLSSRQVYTNYDLVVLWLGTNDGLTDTLETDVNPYSDYHDYANTNTGSYCKIIESILDANPRCNIVLLQCFTSSGNLTDTRTVLDKIAQKYDLPLFETDWLSLANNPSYSYHAGTNNIHLGIYGSWNLAKKLWEYMFEYYNTNWDKIENGIQAAINPTEWEFMGLQPMPE